MLIDEFTRKYLVIRAAQRINSFGVIETMADAGWRRSAYRTGLCVDSLLTGDCTIFRRYRATLKVKTAVLQLLLRNFLAKQQGINFKNQGFIP
jgi:hypothetical protein